MPGPILPKIDRIDLAFIAGLVALVAAYVWRFYNFSALPYEDAAMVMRYAVHLADGHGIVWNIGEAPVDGTTDFLFMVTLAGAVKLGMSIEVAVHFVGITSHLLTVVLIYVAVRELHGSGRWVAAASATYLALGPGLGYVAAYFGTPFFALFAALTWYFAMKVIITRQETGVTVAFVGCALALGLIRPEGVFFSALVLVSVVYVLGLRYSHKTVAFFAGVFLAIGGAYFVWRWWYFGHPLPNPYYVKGAFEIYPDSLVRSVKNTILLGLPIGVVYLAALRSRRALREAVVSAIPVVGFTVIWIFLSDDMNHMRRFQYPVLPVMLMAWPGLWVCVRKEWKMPKFSQAFGRAIVAAVLAIAVAYGGVMWLHRKHRPYVLEDSFHDGRYDAARLLYEYRDRGYCIATTEAGNIPLFSEWKALDTWGLNDPWIAQRGGFTTEYLDRHAPEVIMFHADMSVMRNTTSPSRWDQMVINLRLYAESRDYVTAAVFRARSGIIHAYYVRRGFVDSDALIERLRNMDYVWYLSGNLCRNMVDGESM